VQEELVRRLAVLVTEQFIHITFRVKLTRVRARARARTHTHTHHVCLLIFHKNNLEVGGMIEFMCWQIDAWKRCSTPVFTGKTLLIYFCVISICGSHLDASTFLCIK
jgi:hypothetical protein